MLRYLLWMPTLTLTCLRSDVHDPVTSSVYPLFCGFSSARDLKLVSQAPAYSETTPHQAIAAMIAQPPVDDWQRPLDDERVNRISLVFNQPGKVMPNPVLLAEDLLTTGNIEVVPMSTPGGQLTGTYEVKLTYSAGRWPLWILDGQHRINGLALSNQSLSPLPFVLLLKEGASSYQAAHFAEIFAQVTTQAEDLRSEHREWLSYAFDLGKYAVSTANQQEQKQAFATAVNLCATPGVTGASRPFWNGVKFNPYLPVTASNGGFGRSCQDLASLIRKSYYSQAAHGGQLAPTDLASQLSSAYVALHQKVLNPQDSVFFSSAKQHEMKVMQDAFIHGCLAFMLKYGQPGNAGSPVSSWVELLDNLRFDQTPWDFSTWVQSLSGAEHRESESIAFAVFEERFLAACLPAPSVQGGTRPNIVNILKGDGAAVSVELSRRTPRGAPSKRGMSVTNFGVPANQSLPVPQGFEHLRVRANTANIASVHLEVAYQSGGLSRPIRAKSIDLAQTPPPFDLVVRCNLFGGSNNAVQLGIS